MHGYGILGQTELTADECRHVAKALNDGLQNAGAEAACFLPRHAIRIEQGGVARDYLICFECLRFHVYENGKETDFGLITESPEPVLDELLKQAGVPLAPKAFSEEWHAEIERTQPSNDSGEATD